MKFAVCLALALTCGVVLSNQWTCSNAINGVRQTRDAIATENRRTFPDSSKLNQLENQMANFTQTIFNYCNATDSCSFSKSEIQIAEEATRTEKRRTFPDEKLLAKLEATIDNFRRAVINFCNATEVCQNSQAEIRKIRDVIATEKRRTFPDEKLIAKLETQINNFKSVINYKCNSNETCAFSQAEYKLANDAIATEKRRTFPDEKLLAKLEAGAFNSSEVILNSCNTNDLCSFLSVEIRTVQNALATEKRRTFPDSKVVAKLENTLNRFNSAQNYRCYGSRFLSAISSVKFGETTCNGAKTAFDVAQKVLELLHKAGTNGPKVQQALAAVGEAQALVRRLC